MLAAKDARRNASRQFAQQAVDGLVKIVEFAALAHLLSHDLFAWFSQT
jgi:hypothetical protein